MNRPVPMPAELNMPLENPTSSIGELLILAGRLRHEDVDRVRRRQRESQARFGESAIELGLVSASDVEAALAVQFGAPPLNPASSELAGELVCATDPRSPTAQAICRLRTGLMLRQRQRPGPLVLAVTSAERGCGRTFLAANLAIAFAQVRARTMLVDADMRHGRLGALFGADGHSGLARVLIGRATITDVVPVLAHDTLAVMGAGSAPNPQELLSTPTFHRVIRALSAEHDVVILDTPAWSDGGDAEMVAAEADTSLLLAGLQRTGMREVARFARALELTGTAVFGVALGR